MSGIYKVGESGTMDSMHPLNPEEIAEYIHEEHTPYSTMSLEESKKHLAELIHRYADWYLSEKLTLTKEDWNNIIPKEIR